MINSEETVLARELVDKLSAASNAMVEQYSHWFLISSVGWILLGIVICIAAFTVPFDEDCPALGRWLVRCGGCFIGAIFIFANIPDLVAPKAAAMHQILRDVRSSK